MPRVKVTVVSSAKTFPDAGPRSSFFKEHDTSAVIVTNCDIHSQSFLLSHTAVFNGTSQLECLLCATLVRLDFLIFSPAFCSQSNKR